MVKISVPFTRKRMVIRFLHRLPNKTEWSSYHLQLQNVNCDAWTSGSNLLSSSQHTSVCNHDYHWQRRRNKSVHFILFTSHYLTSLSVYLTAGGWQELIIRETLGTVSYHTGYFCLLPTAHSASFGVSFQLVMSLFCSSHPVPSAQLNNNIESKVYSRLLVLCFAFHWMNTVLTYRLCNVQISSSTHITFVCY
jgi:hypothetical protein